MPHDLVVPFLFQNDYIGLIPVNFLSYNYNMRNNFLNPKKQSTCKIIWLTYLLGRNALRSTNSNRFAVPRIKRNTGSRFFSTSGPALWNAFPVPIRNAGAILTFRKLLISHLFDLAFPP